MSDTRDEGRQKASAVPIEDQAQRLREHYEEAATALGHWSSQIPVAINEWEQRRLRADPSGEVGEERGVGHMWEDPPGGRCLTCHTGWNTKQGEGRCPYPVEERFQKVADGKAESVHIGPSQARWFLARLRRTHESEASWVFDDGSRWELGDSMAGGSHPDSEIIDGQMVPGFVTLRLVDPDGKEAQYEYVRARRTPEESEREARLGRLLLESVTPEAWSILIGAVVDANDDIGGPLLERLNEIGRALATQDHSESEASVRLLKTRDELVEYVAFDEARASEEQGGDVPH